MLFTTFPVRKTLNTKHIQRYATALSRIQTCQVTGNHFQNADYFMNVPTQQGRQAQLKLTAIQTAAVKIDGTVFSTELVLLAELSCTQVPAITSALLLPPLAELQPGLTPFPVQTHSLKSYSLSLKV